MPSTWLICNVISFLRSAGEKSRDQGMRTLVVGEGQVPGSQGSALCFILSVKALKALTPFTRAYKGNFRYRFLIVSCGIFAFLLQKLNLKQRKTCYHLYYILLKMELMLFHQECLRFC